MLKGLRGADATTTVVLALVPSKEGVKGPPIILTTGSAAVVPFQIMTGVITVKSVTSLDLLVVLCRDLKTGSVPSAATLIMLVVLSATGVSTRRTGENDFMFIHHFPNS